VIASRSVPRLGPKAARALRSGITNGSDDSRSAALMAFLVGARNAGWIFNEIKDAVFDPVNVGGAKIREIRDMRGLPRAITVLEARCRDAQRFVANNQQVLDANGARYNLTVWLEQVEATIWKGSAGVTDRVTLHAMAKQAKHTTSVSRVPMSVRKLAELCGYHRTTAIRSLRRLRAAGWLRLVEGATATLPALYALTIPMGCERAAPPSDAGPIERVGAGGSQPHDAWRWTALGKGSQRVYALLENFGAAAEISSQLGISRSATHRHLRRLRGVGLVENHGGRWYLTGRSLEDMLEREFPDVLGAGERQRAEHAQHYEQRNLYRQRRTA
jgi:predicted transcriptional regulator